MSIFNIAGMCKWSKWLDIDRFAEIPSLPGVYGIRLIALPDNSPVPIPRFLHTDKEGVLAIGESKYLRRRIRQFYRVIEERKGFLRHSAGDRLFLNLVFGHASSQAFFNDRGFQVSFSTVQDKVGAQRLEELILKVYFVQFGELPPLNNSMPDRDFKLWDEAVLLAREQTKQRADLYTNL